MGNSIISRIPPKIVQELGESQSSVMSQKASSTLLAAKEHTHTMNDIEPIKVSEFWILSDLTGTFPELTSYFMNAVYMGGAYYIPSMSQKIIKTSDFTSFQIFDFPSIASRYQGFCYDKKDNIFMTIKDDGGSNIVIYTSPDAINWTAKTAAILMSSSYLVSDNNGTYVTYGNKGLWVSHDTGETWTQIEPYSGSGAANLKFLNGMFFLPYNQNDRKIKYSADGDSWQETTLPQAQSSSTSDVRNISYGNGVYVVPRYYDTYVTVSNDLQTWTNVTAGSGYGNYGITFGSGTFKLFSQNKRCFNSSDGINWFADPVGTMNFVIQNAFYLGKYFVGLTTDQNAVLYSKLDYTMAKAQIADGGTGADNLDDAKINLEIPGLVQTAGASATSVMSQQAVTDAINGTLPAKPSSGTYYLKCVDGVLSWENS